MLRKQHIPCVLVVQLKLLYLGIWLQQPRIFLHLLHLTKLLTYRRFYFHFVLREVLFRHEVLFLVLRSGWLAILGKQQLVFEHLVLRLQVGELALSLLDEVVELAHLREELPVFVQLVPVLAVNYHWLRVRIRLRGTDYVYFGCLGATHFGLVQSSGLDFLQRFLQVVRLRFCGQQVEHAVTHFDEEQVEELLGRIADLQVDEGVGLLGQVVNQSLDLSFG